MSIVVERRVTRQGGPGETHRRMEVMKGEIAGFSTVLHVISGGEEVRFDGSRGIGGSYLFLAGHASIRQDAAEFRVREIALFCPLPGTAFRLTAGQGPVHILEMKLTLSDEDLNTYAERRESFPYFRPYSACRIYTERIKSPKAINRELISHGTVPRLAIGSVESPDDDTVALHEHAMLEQHFLGLAGNDCTVTADGESVHFGEHDLLHIPPGSRHGVRATTPGGMNYIWIDVFDSQEGEDFLVREHKDVDP